jgi:hypothetical protein
MSYTDGIRFAGNRKAKIDHPTDVGRHVSCGLRQSMPDNKYPSCADEIVTAPSAGLGHKNRPRSRRFVNKHAP